MLKREIIVINLDRKKKMAQVVGVSVYRYPTKRDALLFDKFYIMRPQTAVLVWRLKEKRFTFVDVPKDRDLKLAEYLINNDFILNFDPENEIKKLEGLEPDHNGYNLLSHGRDTIAIMAQPEVSIRKTCVALKKLLDCEIVGLVGGISDLSLSIDEKEFETAQKRVYEIVIKKLPVPSDETLWQDIIEFRKNPEARLRFLELKKWMSNLVTTTSRPSEIKEEVEYLLLQYEQSMKLHKMKYNKSALRTVIISAAGFIENSLKLKIKDIASGIFDIKDHKVKLMEAEASAKGREISYIIRANEKFRRE